MNGRRETHLTSVFPVLFIGLTPDGGNFLVISRHGDEGFIRNAFVEFILADEADDGVAAFDVMVEKVERLAGIVSLQPKRDFTQFDGEGVEVNSIDAGANQMLEEPFD